jgi:hypothetical protein
VDSSDAVKVRILYKHHNCIYNVSKLLSKSASIYCKEPGASSLPLVSSGAVDRIGSSFLEPSLTTRDVLDKYQIVAQKVVADIYSYCDIRFFMSYFRSLL